MCNLFKGHYNNTEPSLEGGSAGMKLYQRKLHDPAPLGQPDPFIFVYQNKYYIYATHPDGVQLYCSNSLTSGWEYKGFCFSLKNEKNYWAPALLEYNGMFYLYVSTTPADR